MSLSLDLESIVLLLFFIAPGFLFTRTYTAYRPRYYQPPSAFEQFVLAIVGSTVIHAAILTTLALLLGGYGALTGQLVYLSSIIDPAIPLSAYPAPLAAGGLFGATVYLILSLITARRLATFLGQRTPTTRPTWWTAIFGQDPPEPFLLWHTVLQIEPLELELIPPRLAIQMRSGEYFEGDLHRFRLVGDEENTVELALRNVSQRLPPDAPATDSRLKRLPNRVLLLSSKDILWLTREDMPQPAVSLSSTLVEQPPSPS